MGGFPAIVDAAASPRIAVTVIVRWQARMRRTPRIESPQSTHTCAHRPSENCRATPPPRSGHQMQSSRQLIGIVLLGSATVLFSSLGSGWAAAAESDSRPRIGLVLAGGGAKGGAHVGVLKVLEELHVPID